MTFVATPACVVEKLGVSASMDRSAQLTKGQRWKILGKALLVLIPGILGSAVIDAVVEEAGIGFVAASAGQVIWEGIWGSYYAILAIAMDSGKILWTRQFTQSDQWNVSCLAVDKVGCPPTPGSDFDFGSSPILRTLAGGTRLLIAGQKSGIVHALSLIHI